MRPRLVAVAGLLLLAGCAAGVPETPQERQARFQAACNEAGFKADTEANKLCLLIQQQSVVDTDNASPFGRIHYHEQIQLLLKGLTPQR